MKKINFTELMLLPDLELLKIFEDHDDYATPTLLFCYAEIKRRNIVLSDSLINDIKEVTDHLKIDSFDSEVIKAANNRGYDSYEEFYQNIMKPTLATTPQNEVPTSEISKGTIIEKIQGNQNEKRNTNKQSYYKVVPFPATNNVSNALQGIVNSESVNGWRYVNHQYSDKLKPGDKGCFGIGATADSTIHIGVVIFEKD